MEEWKEIEGYDYPYRVSSLGNVTGRNGKKLKPRPSKGYTKVALYKNKTAHNKTIHRLVAKAFLPNPENKATVNHKNGIKDDNRVENLEWATYGENNIHANETGLRENKPWSEDRRKRQTLYRQEDIYKLRSEGHSVQEVCEIMGCSKSTVLTATKVYSEKTGQDNFNRKSSKYIGVSKSKIDGRWEAYIQIKGKKVNLGRYKNEEDAAKVYDRKAVEEGKPKDKLNFPDGH